MELEKELYEKLTEGSYRHLAPGDYSEDALIKASDLLSTAYIKQMEGEENQKEVDQILDLIPNRLKESTYRNVNVNDVDDLIKSAFQAKKDRSRKNLFGETKIITPLKGETEQIISLCGETPRAIYKIVNTEAEYLETEWRRVHDIPDVPDEEDGSLGSVLLFHGSSKSSWVPILKDDRLDPTVGRDGYRGGWKTRSMGSIEDDFGVEQGNYYTTDIRTAKNYGNWIGIFDIAVGKPLKVSEKSTFTEYQLKEQGCDSLSLNDGQEIVAREGICKFLLEF